MVKQERKTFFSIALYQIKEPLFNTNEKYYLEISKISIFRKEHALRIAKKRHGIILAYSVRIFLLNFVCNLISQLGSPDTQNKFGETLYSGSCLKEFSQ